MVIDLLKLGNRRVLHTFLTRLLKPDTIIKAGCGIGDDIAKIGRSYPALTALQACNGLLDIRFVFVQHVSATGLPVTCTRLLFVGACSFQTSCKTLPTAPACCCCQWAT